MGDQRRVILVGCGQRKLSRPAPARELYTGALFVAQRRYAEASGCPWAILSAKHGLVLPGRILEPYDQRLPGSRSLRQLWAWRVLGELAQWDRETDAVEVLAGEDYVAALRLAPGWSSLSVTEPLRGLTLGHRRRRLAEMTAERQAAQEEVSHG